MKNIPWFSGSYRLNEVVKYDDLTPAHKQHIETIYPIINRELAEELNLDYYKIFIKNPNQSNYERILDKINALVSNYINVPGFPKDRLIVSPNMIELQPERISTIPKEAAILEFGNNATELKPYASIFEASSGPYAPTTKKVKYFFIAPESAKDKCIKLYTLFKKGFNDELTSCYPAFTHTMKDNFNTDANSSIYFKSVQTLLTDVVKGLNNKSFDTDTLYFAIYVSPISKDSKGEGHEIYYKLKELLLKRGITSQAIYINKMNDSGFKFYIPNIYCAMLAKIHGIPWQIHSPSKTNDLIIGIGAFRSSLIGERYIGGAFCFNNEGICEEFDCYRDDDLDRIVEGIRKGMMTYLNKHAKADRLVIHYYKTMSSRESRKITDMLNKINHRIPLYVLTINKTEENDYFAWKPEHSDLMPLSGTCIRIDQSSYLLYNNEKYSPDQTLRKREYLLPIKIQIRKIAPDNQIQELDSDEANELLTQVYQLSRMNWKSVAHQNLPVTVKFPEMLAKIVPHFQDAQLPPFGKTNLWFL